jgi:hypothetical protein
MKLSVSVPDGLWNAAIREWGVEDITQTSGVSPSAIVQLALKHFVLKDDKQLCVHCGGIIKKDEIEWYHIEGGSKVCALTAEPEETSD